MFNQLQKNIRKYFGISRTEANGLMVLILLMILLILSPLIYRQCGIGAYQNYEKDLALLDSLSDILFLSTDSTVSDKPSLDPDFTSFDPNRVSFSNMVRMGIDSLLARRIISYRRKGGIFHEPRDLLKIYDFPDTLYKRIHPIIRIPQKEEIIPTPAAAGSTASVSDRRIESSQNWIPVHMDLNEADTTQLISIKGIGSVFSNRIVKYRDLLGGYVSIEQLDEVYGLKEETLLNLKERVYVDSIFEPEMIRINFF